MDEFIIKFTNTLLGLVGISALAATSRSILSEDRRSLAGFIRGFILAVFTGGIVGALIQDYDFSAATQGGIVGISAFVADDILLLIIALSRTIRNNPKIIMNYLFRRPNN